MEEEIDINIKFLNTDNKESCEKILDEIDDAIKKVLSDKKYLDFISVNCWRV